MGHGHAFLIIAAAGLASATACDKKPAPSPSPEVVTEGDPAPTAPEATKVEEEQKGGEVEKTEVASEPEPSPVIEMPPSEVPDKVQGANFQIGTSTVDGLTLKDLSCKLEGGFLAGAAIMGALSKQRTSLESCVESPAQIRVGWSGKGGAAQEVNVKGAPSPKSAACVADVLAKSEGIPNGACAATLVLGEPAKE